MPVLKRIASVQYLFLFVVVTISDNMFEGDAYLESREKVLSTEQGNFTGGDVNLTEKEKVVDEFLLRLKHEELAKSYKNSSAFLGARNFLEAREEIEKSKVFQFIQKIPKGASLHTHMLAGVNVDYVIQNFTYMDNVYGCNNTMGIFKLRVMQDPKEDANCSWKSVETYRKEYKEKNKNFDDFLRSKMALDKKSVSEDREDVWAVFKATFSCLYDLVAYRPIFKSFIYQLLQELYDDNIIYTELRGTFMPLYDLNGTTYNTKVFFDTFIKTVEDFKATHPNFLGVKYIHSIYRGVDKATLMAGLHQLVDYKKTYQNFIAGFDFVGLEEEGHNLVDFHEALIEASKSLKFFFHAGETNQFGHVDLNMVDAMLLNCSRLGHGFALAKHPEVMKMGKDKKVAVEVCPISNQVLKLIDDPRNHPASVLLSRGYPVVICNDDPSAWYATGLSYDWYVTFMAMTWQNQGLTVLKRLAQDSIQFSAMNDSEKKEAYEVWQRQWDQFIDDMQVQQMMESTPFVETLDR